MKLNRVAVLGGGPGGLYAARLLKLADPGCQVDVYEQGRPDATFGFGVGLAAGTQRNLQAADGESLESIQSAGRAHDMELRTPSGTARMPGDNLRAIGRTTLLSILQDHARTVSVDLHFGARVTPADLDADLVIAADGVSSATRDAHTEELGVQIEVGRSLYLWAGTDLALSSAMFAPVTTEHGTFVTHAYPYAADRSTFLIETDEQTWQRAGMDGFTERTPFDESDQQSLDCLSTAFAAELQGHPLIGNRTRWLRFRTVRCRRWHVGNTVLLGDAAHTAHYSIGSGTKLAMEDAISLVGALGEATTVPEALETYEAQRRPAVEHLQAVAVRSQRWWDSFPRRTHLPVNRLFVSYMTRAGKVSLDRLAVTAPDIMQRALAEYGAGTESPASEPVELAVPPGDPWTVRGTEIIEHVTELVDDGQVLRLTGPGDRDAVLDRLDLAERIRLDLGATVIVRAPDKHLPDLTAGLVAGRTDLIETTAGED